MNQEKLEAFVAGATGFTGREVVRQLVELGVDTIAHIRPGSPRKDDCRSAFEEWGARVAFTPWDEDAMSEMLAEQRPDLVFCLIGTTRARMRRAEEPEAHTYEAIDYGLTDLLVSACVRAGIEPRFVYLSAVGVSSDARTRYMKARWKAETSVRESGLPYTIARPSFISGPGREEPRPLERVGAATADFFLKALGGIGFSKLRDRYLSMTNTELACALITWGRADEGKNRVLEPRELRTDHLKRIE